MKKLHAGDAEMDCMFEWVMAGIERDINLEEQAEI